MFRSKKDVDKHVQESFRKIKSENERSLRCYNVAKLYYAVGDYESARHYVRCYLSVRPDVAGAHKLLGQALEGLKQQEQALEAYKCSLKLESRQPDLVLRVCDLIVETEAQLDPGTARYWKERAEESAAHHPVVFKFKEYLIKMNGGAGDCAELEQLVKKEIEARPTEVSLRVRLLKLYVDSKRAELAYKHAVDLEARSAFRNDIQWYTCLFDVMKAYRREVPDHKSDWEFHINHLCVVERLTSLCLREQQGLGPPTFTAALFELDQALHEASQLSQHGGDRLLQECVRHMGGQLCLHLGTAVLRVSKQSRTGWRESASTAPPLLLLAWATPITSPSTWTSVSKDTERYLKLWEKDGAFRCTQAGYVLLGMVRERRTQFLLRVSQQCVQGWREKMYQKVFVSPHHVSAMATSYFVQHNGFAEVSNSFPTFHNLREYCTLSQQQQPDSLHHLVWLGLQDIAGNMKRAQATSNTSNSPYLLPYRFSTDFSCRTFDNLQLTTSNLQSCSVETFSRLDADTFLYASVLCAAGTQEDLRSRGFLSEGRPPVLPVDLTEPLCTPAQAKWWHAAYRLYNNPGNDLSEMRMTIQRGLEVIRVLGNHGMDVQLVVQLAKIYSEKASSLSTKMEAAADVPALEARALLYWNCALSLLERLEKNQLIRMPECRLFSYTGKELGSNDIKSLIEEGRFYLACRLMKDEQYEKAIEAFQKLKNPYASFYQAQIYKKLADAEMMVSGEMITSEMRSKHVILLLKSRSALHLTLDRLRAPHVDTNHPLNAELDQYLEEVESLLARVEPDITLTSNRNACDGTSDDSLSSNRSGDNLHSASRLANPPFHQSMLSSLVDVVNGRSPNRGVTSSTPLRNKHQLDATYITNISDCYQQKRTEARPSPERLDAQLRRMAHNNDAVLQTLMEQNRQILESNKHIVEALDKNKLAVEDLQSQLNDLQREMGKLKLSSTSRTQTDRDSDLNNYLFLEDDYAEETPSRLSSIPMPFPSYDTQYSGYRPQISSVQALPTMSYGTSNIPTQVLPPFFPQPQIPIPGYVDLSASLFHNLYPLGVNAVDGQRVSGVQGTVPVTTPTSGLSGIPIPAATVAVPGLGAVAPAPLPVPVPIPAAPQASSIGGGSVSELGVTPSQVVRSQALPVNVVITSSDVVPTQAPAQQPTLSVTIPPQHIRSSVLASQSKPTVTATVAANTSSKLAPHDFQIAMPPQANIPTTSSLEKMYSSVAVTSPAQTQHQGDSKQSRVSMGSASGDDTYPEDIDYNPCADFKPIIPLPEEVTVTTGEENETPLFNCRAKLYRFVEREWKERGVGQIKILKHNITGKMRILMRREQVHKICANHLLTPEMELAAQTGTDRAWTWVAQDFSENEVQVEKLCVRFKTVEDAVQFKEVFDKACEAAKKVASPEKTSQSLSTPVTVQAKSPALSKTETGGKVELGGFTFTSQPVLKPVETPKSATKDKEAKDISQAKPSPFAGFSFSSATSATSSIFGKPAVPTTSSTVTSSVTNGAVTSSIFGTPSIKTPISSTSTSSIFGKPAFGFPASEVARTSVQQGMGTFTSTFTSTPTATSVFGVPKASSAMNLNKDSAVTSDKDDTPKGGLMFGTGSSVDFATLAAQNQGKGVGKKDAPFKGFEGAGSMVFGNTTSSPKVSAANDDEGAGAEEEFEPTAVFNPVIPLPSLVEVRTGEEDEEVLFEERAKLLRFNRDTNEWKERGVGKMKVLRDGKTGKVRLLMRREQVLKVCCNHYITKDLQFREMTTSDKAVMWSANDFAEGEVQPEVFALRFKTPDLMHKFKDVVEDIQSKLTDTPQGSPAPPQQAAEKNPAKPLSELFKPKQGSWECSGCFTRNEAGVTACPCCNTRKPGCEAAPAKANTLNAKQFSFGVKEDEKHPSLAEMFKPKEGSWECSGCYTRNDVEKTVCPACNTTKPGIGTQPTSLSTGFSFGNTATKTEKEPSLAEMFKPKEGSWECQSCYTRNEGDKISCLACTTPKPGHEGDVKSAALTSSSSTSFSFGIPTTQTAAFSFGVPTTHSTQNTETKTFDFNSTLSSQKSDVKFPFGNQSAPFSFGFQPVKNVSQSTTVSSGFSFGSSTVGKEPENGAAFGSPHKFEFEFRAKSPTKSPVKSPGAPSGEEESDGEVEEAEDIHFQPVIPLPDKVPLYTGEEDENVLYSHRAKLYRYVGNEWKERGVGDIKILQHKITHKVRLLMRREQVLKLCLNHFLSKDLEVVEKDDKTWMWGAQDFSEGTISTEKFACRFKTPEIASQFKQALDRAKAGLVASPAPGKTEITSTSATTAASNDGGAVNNATPAMKSFTLPDSSSGTKPGVVRSLFGATHPAASSDSDEVQIVYEAEVTPQERAAALKLKLPENFYLYKRAPSCAGCPGCENDSDSDQNEVNASTGTSTGTTATMATMAATTAVTTPGTTAVSTETAITTPSFASGGSLFGPNSFSFQSKTPIFGAGSAASLFSEKSANPIFGSLSAGVTAVPNKDKGTVTPTSGSLSSSAFKFSSKTETIKTEKPGESNGDAISFLPVNESLTFSSLAAASPTQPAFKTDPSKAFSFAGAGAKVFGSSPVTTGTTMTPKKGDGDSSGDEGDEAGNDTHDPHFEPIIALPDMVEVRTGEEDEEKLFGQRAKLYRYDATSKEWKERGVGDMKVLKHPDMETYRLLLRREQVHKVVLNQRVTSDLQLSPLRTSETAWCWGGMNYAEGSEGSLEELAVRFKSKDHAEEFFSVIENCRKNIRIGGHGVGGKMVGDNGGEGASADDEDNDDDEGDEDDEYEDEYSDGEDEYDEEDSEILFRKSASLIVQSSNSDKTENLGEVELYVLQLANNTAWVRMDDKSGKTLCRTQILGDGEAQLKGKSCIWNGEDCLADPVIGKQFIATFSTEEDAEQFQEVYYRVATEIVEQTYQYVEEPVDED